MKNIEMSRKFYPPKSEVLSPESCLLNITPQTSILTTQYSHLTSSELLTLYQIGS